MWPILYTLPVYRLLHPQNANLKTSFIAISVLFQAETYMVGVLENIDKL